MPFWLVFLFYAAVTLMVLAVAESARTTGMRIKPVFGLPLIGLCIASILLLVFIAIGHVRAGMWWGWLELAAFEVPLLLGWLWLSMIQAGRRIGEAAANPVDARSRALAAVMEPMSSNAPSGDTPAA